MNIEHGLENRKNVGFSINLKKSGGQISNEYNEEVADQDMKNCFKRYFLTWRIKCDIKCNLAFIDQIFKTGFNLLSKLE